ncbi:nucleotidyltransferase family protein [Sandarakinorhabdus sp. AAP62]|uniref:nucleotidyltransferase family protein n=1 Tax=Sandarakinorhabdus sp. AAP62 TaxID=1248916 RepID=UPI0002DE8238|nr:nucleotidyltransferase family protein [Sandarakinorhabdus sp. AAP62]
MTEDAFRDATQTNPFNAQLLDRLAALALPDCHLTAGCLFQTVWNQRSGRDPAWGISDYDVFYFDASDLSWEAEDRVIQRVAAATADLPITVEVKNQARVHLWYGERFGGAYPQLHSAPDGIKLFLVSSTCVGIDVQSRAVFAPYGLDDLYAGRLGMNRFNPKPEQYRAKAASYQQRWEWLTIIDAD